MFKWTSTLAVLLIAAMMLVGCSSDPLSSYEEPYTPTTSYNSRGALSASNATTLTSATLHMWESGNNDQTINIYRVTEDWDEMTVTWNSFGGAFTDPIIASFIADSFGPKRIDVTPLVQTWCDGTFPNYGLLLDQDPFNTPRGAWYSREVTDREPYLVVCYMEDGVEVCDTSIATADTYIHELRPDDNFGGGSQLYTGWRTETDKEKQALLRFNVTPPPPDSQSGCSHTIGFWKTHAGFGPQADEVTQYLPIWLGDAGGSASLEVTTAAIAVDVLKMKTYGKNSNGITKLYAQLLGTKLSIADGASDDDVAAAIAAADAFLANNDWTDWKDLSDADQQMVLDWQGMFDDYNNGIIGPGHCDDFEDESEQEEDNEEGKGRGRGRG